MDMALHGLVECCTKRQYFNKPTAPQALKLQATHEGDFCNRVVRSPGAQRPQETSMLVRRPKTKREQLGEWRVAKTIKPRQRGAIKLARVHGQDLICVRYRENSEGTERMTTIELIVEHVVIQKRDDPIVSFKIKHDETELRRLAMARGAKYDSQNHMWRLPRSEVLRMGLKARIAVTNDDLCEEHVHP